MRASSEVSAFRSRAPVPARGPWRVLALVALLGTVAALYARTARHEFVGYDDPAYVFDNPMVASGLGLEGLRWSFGFHEGNWHPLTWLAHMLDVEIFGLDAGAHHLVSAGWHVLNAALLYWLVLRLTGAGWSALLVAALFALHPLRVESVAWASERKDVLAGTFWLLTLLAYERYARRGGRGPHALALACFALGLMTKSMLVTLPLVLLLLDRWPLEHTGSPENGAWPRRLTEKLPFLALALATGAATLWIQHDQGAVGTLGALSPMARLCNASLAYWVYLGQSLWPLDLACFVPHPVVVTPAAELARVLYWPGAAAFLGLLGVSALAWRQRRTRPHVFLGWAWYLLVAAPVIGFVQVGQQAHADRYTYLPLIGPTLALVFELRALALRRPALRPALVLASVAWLLALVPLTWRQIGTWRSSRTLFTHALAVTSHNYLAGTFLGMVERREGSYEAAREHLEQALEANKQHVTAMLELGLTLESLGDLPGARRLLNRALRNDPGLLAADRARVRVEAALEGR